MKIHNLKTWPEYFQAVWNGIKPWEYRKDDRSYHTGDCLHLQEWDPKEEKFTGREIFAIVTYILKNQMGIPEGYAILSIKELSRRG